MEIAILEEPVVTTVQYPHFAALVKMAVIDGKVSKEERTILKELAKERGITKKEFKAILRNQPVPQISASCNTERRIKLIFDMFRMAFANHQFHARKRRFLFRYAFQIGFCKKNIRMITQKSINLFSGRFGYKEYDFCIRN